MNYSFSKLALFHLGIFCLVLMSCTSAATRPSGGTSTGVNLPMALLQEHSGKPFLFAALKAGGVQVFSTSSSGEVQRIARISRNALGGLDAMNLHQENNRLYVALGDHFSARGSKAGLAVLDIGNPKAPTVLGLWQSVDAIKGAGDVTVEGETVWLGAMSAGVIGLDVSNPRRPKEISRFRPDPNFPKKNPGRLQIPAARGLYVAGNRLYVAYDAGGLRVLNISNPANPREIGRYVNPDMGKKPNAYNNITIRRGLAYAAIDYCGVEVIDIRNARSMKQTGWWNPWECNTPNNNWFNSPGHTNQIVWLDRNRLAFSSGDAELVVVDVSNPAKPKEISTLGGHKDGLGSWSVAVGQSDLYLGYIRTIIPFRGTWSGIRKLPRP